MSEPIIFNETDFEENLYDFFTYMKYKGELFTGTVIIENDKLDNVGETKEIVEFKNGNVHGRYLEYNKNGQLFYDGFYQDGKCLSEKYWDSDGQISRDWDYAVSGKDWYPDGQLKEHWDGKDSFLWDKDGLLARKNNEWFYKNGQQMHERLADNTELFFSPTGELALKREQLKQPEFNPEFNVTYHDRFYYYDSVFSQFYEALFTDFYPDFSHNEYYKPGRILLFFGWVAAVYSEDSIRGNYFIDRLMEHPTKETSARAHYLKRLALKKESGSTEITYWLEKSPCKIIIK